MADERDLSGEPTTNPGDISDAGPATAQGQDETMHPALQAFRGAVPGEVGAGGWLSNVLTRINDWATGRDIADQSRAHAEAYTKNVDTFKQGLIQMVQADPTAVTVARDVVPDTLKHLLPSNLSDDQHRELYNVMGAHVQQEVVQAAVHSLAEKSPVMAQRMLESTVGAILDDGTKQSLGAYIAAQRIAQGADSSAQAAQAADNQSRATAAAGHTYGEQLINPGNGGAGFPPGWASRLISDQGVSPEEKGSLMGAYGRLQANGDVAESNGHSVYAALTGMRDGSLSSNDLWNGVGTGIKGLSIKDATWLNGLMHSETPEGRANRDGFTNALDDAAKKLMGPSGNNGASGARNFNNYAKWLISAYQQTGVAGLDPNHEQYLYKNVGTNSFDGQNVFVEGKLYHGGPQEKQHVSAYFRNSSRGSSSRSRRR